MLVSSKRSNVKAFSTDGWEIASFVGVGPIRFGMPREDVRRLLGVPRPNGWDLLDFSHFDTHEASRVSIQVIYAEADGLCEFIEIFGGSNDSNASLPKARRFAPGGASGPVVEGRGVLGRPYDRALEWCRTRDPLVVLNDAGLRSRALGLSLFAPAATKEPWQPIESVAAFTRSYLTRLYGETG